MSEELVQVLNAVEKRLKPLRDYRKKREWKFKQEKITGAEKFNYDDSFWKIVNLPYNWEVKQEAWFRKKITIPESIEGIFVEGSKIEIFSSVALVPVEVFIDEKKVFSADHWADFRGPRILISEKASPKEEHIIVIHTLTKEGMGNIPLIELCYSKVDNIALEIASFIEEVKFAQGLPGGEKLSKKALEGLSVDNIITSKTEELLNIINQAREVLSPLKPLAKQHKIHLIGHAHIDMNWLWPWEETIDVCRRDFSTITHLMEEFPNLYFSQSQTVTYELMEKKFPEIFKKIKQKVNEGRWDITASTWVEGDLNMAQGEAIVRQLLYGKGYIKEKFGIEPKICWEPDTFGHPWTMPQILKKSGIEYYYFMRCGKGSPLFWWEGLDGSRVLAFNSVYNAFINPSPLVKLSQDFVKKYGTKTAMFVYGVGDHGGGPTREDIKIAEKLDKKEIFPHLEFSTTHKFFETIAKENLDLPVVKDELNFIFDGCWSTHGDIKEHNRKCERLLLDTEIIGSIAKSLGGNYPDLKESWKKTLFNQFHDILDGSAIHSSYEYSDKLAEEVESIAKDTIFKNLSFIANNINIKEKGTPILVFNPLPWERKDVVKIDTPEDLPSSFIVKDTEGGNFPAQIFKNKLLFVATLPPMGYKIFYIIEGESKENGTTPSKNYTLENEFLKLEISEKSGCITYLYDKKNKKIIMKENRSEATCPVMNNLLQVFYELPHSMSAWVIGPISKVENLLENAEVSLLVTGPVMETIRVKHKFNKSTITQDISIYKEISRIDFTNRIDWQEVANHHTQAPMLKASFTPILSKTKASFEIPFGYIERVGDGREMPALQWVDISDNEYGLSLLSDTKYGFNVKGNTLRMTMVRTGYEPDPAPDKREHNFKYALYPHKGSWKDADTPRKGYEFNHPFISLIVSPGKGNLPPNKSFIKIEPSGVVMSSFKKAEDSDDFILRVYESKGKKVRVNIRLGFPVKKIKEVDLLERPIKSSLNFDKEFSFSIDPYEIKTFKIINEVKSK